MTETANKSHVCPPWLGYFLVSPVRRLFQDPETILTPYVHESMTVLELGPGMGFFSLTLARLVGSQGRVVCVDLQEKMLKRLMKRAANAGVEQRITAIQATQDSLQLDAVAGSVDFTLAFAVIHEIPDKPRIFGEVYRAMKPGGLLFLSEPAGHVTQDAFDKTIGLAVSAGFAPGPSVGVKHSLSMILTR
jgi:ubiquinone/menaquinone biosynthesis C-methylase UbiE